MTGRAGRRGRPLPGTGVSIGLDRQAPDKKKAAVPIGAAAFLLPLDKDRSDQNWTFSVPIKARGEPIWMNGTLYSVDEPPDVPKPPT